MVDKQHIKLALYGAGCTQEYADKCTDEIMTMFNKEIADLHKKLKEVITISEVREILGAMYENLPDGDDELFKTVKEMHNDIADKQANKEDDNSKNCKILPLWDSQRQA